MDIEERRRWLQDQAEVLRQFVHYDCDPRAVAEASLATFVRDNWGIAASDFVPIGRNVHGDRIAVWLGSDCEEAPVIMLRADRGLPVDEPCRVLAPSLDAWIQLLVHGPALNPDEDSFLTELGGPLVDPLRNPDIEDAWAAMMAYRSAVAARFGGVSCFASLGPSPAQERAVHERFNAR